ncbi:MAG: hypothetical protein MASP_00509 [Candidatus Methanolliviera sp. GoM_asphalt]|nr:MAG: hypothetical protein MASP_00509 [Candidatus Methanolliviera sp. GoM_asphalt]
MKKRNIREIGEKILGKFAMMNDLIEKGKIWHVKADEIEMKRLINDCEDSFRRFIFDLMNYHNLTDETSEC